MLNYQCCIQMKGREELHCRGVTLQLCAVCRGVPCGDRTDESTTRNGSIDYRNGLRYQS